jgi:hypothetical protein
MRFTLDSASGYNAVGYRDKLAQFIVSQNHEPKHQWEDECPTIEVNTLDELIEIIDIVGNPLIVSGAKIVIYDDYYE